MRSAPRDPLNREIPQTGLKDYTTENASNFLSKNLTSDTFQHKRLLLQTYLVFIFCQNIA